MDMNKSVNSANKAAIRIYGALCLTVGVILGMAVGKWWSHRLELR